MTKLSVTFLTILTDSPSPEANVENERSASFEYPKSLSAISAALIEMSCKISSVIKELTAQSAKIYSPPFGDTIKK